MKHLIKLNGFWGDVMSFIPGIIACWVVALAAKFVAGYYALPLMLVCLFLGMMFHFMSQSTLTKGGVQFTSKSVLRLGVALIGARIAFSDFISLGYDVLVFVVLATLSVIVFGLFWAKLLKLDNEQGLLIGGATAICGASAALAISSVMPNSKSLEQNTLIAVIGVTAMGTIAMILYPFILGFVSLDNSQAGILIGGTIHDVAQVVGAGYSVSDEVGDNAILVKLIRVFMLVPILFMFAFAFRKQNKNSAAKGEGFPPFLIAFVALVVLNSMGVIPAEFTDILKDASKWCLVIAITAVGMKTSFKKIRSLGWRPIMLVVMETVSITALYVAVIAFGVI